MFSIKDIHDGDWVEIVGVINGGFQARSWKGIIHLISHTDSLTLNNFDNNTMSIPTIPKSQIVKVIRPTAPYMLAMAYKDDGKIIFER